MSIDPKAPITPDAGIENYLLPSKQALDNIAWGPFPPQMTGENIHETPILPAEDSKVEDNYTRETKGDEEQRYEEPSMPYSGSVSSSIWQSRFGGSYIEVSGEKDAPEFINIVQTNGTHISLSPDGTILIKSMGDTHNITRGNMYEHTKGSKTQINNGGYTLSVKDGTLDIRSEGNLNISSGADLNISAAGKLNMNVGDALDIGAARVALTAREDALDLVSKTQTRLSSSGNMSMKTEAELSLHSDGYMYHKGSNIIASADGIMTSKAGSAMVHQAGSKLSLNASLVAIDDVVQLANGLAGSSTAAPDGEPAIKAGVADPIKKSISTENTVSSTTGGAGPSSNFDDNPFGNGEE